MKGRVIKYKPVAKLSGKSSSKKGGMKGGYNELILSYKFKCSAEVRNSNFNRAKWDEKLIQQDTNLKEFCKNEDTKGIFRYFNDFNYVNGGDKISGETGISFQNYKEAKKTNEYGVIIQKLIILIKNIKKSLDELGSLPSGVDNFEVVIPEPNNYSNSSNSSNSLNISKYSYKEFLTYLHQELEKE